MWDFKPLVVRDKFVDKFFSKFFVFRIKFDDFFMFEIQVDGILFLLCNLISINDDLNIHLVVLFGEFLIDFQILEVQMAVASNPSF